MIAAVAVGELLPGNSPILQAVAAAHISDKILHSGAYCLLALVPVFAFRRNIALISVLGLAVMGGALELLQQLVPGRSCDIADEAANVAGLLAGMILVYAWRMAARVTA